MTLGEGNISTVRDLQENSPGPLWKSRSTSTLYQFIEGYDEDIYEHSNGRDTQGKV